MIFFKNHKVIKVGLAFVLLGFLFASVPFFQLIHQHANSTDHSKVTQIKDYEGRCCNPIKIQSNFQGILKAESVIIKLSFIDDYSFGSYNYLFNKSVNLSNKAPPVNPIV